MSKCKCKFGRIQEALQAKQSAASTNVCSPSPLRSPGKEPSFRNKTLDLERIPYLTRSVTPPCIFTFTHLADAFIQSDLIHIT